jgi:WD40 repeat protein
MNGTKTGTVHYRAAEMRRRGARRAARGHGGADTVGNIFCCSLRRSSAASQIQASCDQRWRDTRYHLWCEQQLRSAEGAGLGLALRRLALGSALQPRLVADACGGLAELPAEMVAGVGAAVARALGFHGILAGHSSSVRSACFSPDGQTIVSASSDTTVRVWCAMTGKCIRALIGHSGPVTSVHFSWSGKKIVSGSSDNTVRIWSVMAGECRHTLTGHTSAVTSVDFASNDQMVASASYDQTVRVWCTMTGRCKHTLVGHSGPVFSAAFSPAGQKIVSACADQIVRVWNVGREECVQRLEGHTHTVTSAQFSDDGQKIVSASWDNTVRVWNAVMGKCEQTMKGHGNAGDRLLSAHFSPDNQHIVSAGGSVSKYTHIHGQDEARGRVCIWNAVTGKCLLTIEGYGSEVYSARFNPDGQKILSVSQSVRVTDLRQTNHYIFE